jgi:hypothetical protein
MSTFSPRPPGTVMHGEFHDLRQAVRALRVLKNAGYARAEIRTCAEPQADEPTVVVVDAAARGAARAAEILAEYGAQMHFTSRPEASEPEALQLEPMRLDLQEATPPQESTPPQPATPLPQATPKLQAGPPQATPLQQAAPPPQATPLQQATPPQQSTPLEQATLPKEQTPPQPTTSMQEAAGAELAMHPQDAAQPEGPELVAVPRPKRQPRARKRVR